MEQWKSIEKFGNSYEISNQGRLKSLKRKRVLYDRILNGTYDKDGYKVFCIGKYKFRASRLVAEAFIENPLNLPEVNHRDSNRKNNNDWNLEWCTRKENNLHAIKSGNYKKILNKDKINTIFELSKTLNPYQIARELNIHQSIVYRLLNKKSYMWMD